MDFDADVEDFGGWRSADGESGSLAWSARSLLMGKFAGKRRHGSSRPESCFATSRAASTAVLGAQALGWKEDAWGPQLEGPRTIRDLDSWHQHQIAMMQNNGGAEVRRIAEKSSPGRPITVTTNYSGSGNAEESVVYGIGFVAIAMGRPVEVRCYSACDKQPASRAALLHHDPRSRPEHVFGEVLERAHPKVVRRLERSRVKWKAKAERALKSKQGLARSLGLRRFENWFLQEAGAILKDPVCNVKKKAWCFACNKMCRPHPGFDDVGFTLEVAGSTCVAFSAMSKTAWGWLDESSVLSSCG